MVGTVTRYPQRILTSFWMASCRILEETILYFG
jgi:hypothetical protein